MSRRRLRADACWNESRLVSPEWLDMSIAGTATSLDAFPTAPARTLMVRVRLLHAAFSSGPTPPALTAPRPLSRPPQLLQISIVGAPRDPGARRAANPAGPTVGATPFRSRSCSHTPAP